MNKDNCRCKNVQIVEDVFGEIPSENAEADDAATKVHSYKMSNSCGMEVTVITWGATVISIKCPDKYGQLGDVVLGFDNLDSYLDPRLSRTMGCIVGRCGEQPQQDSEEDSSDIQAGSSFARRPWEAQVQDGRRLVMSYLSPDGEDGRTGGLLLSASFELSENNSLRVGMRAVATKPAVLDLSQSLQLNLSGHAAGPAELRAHELSLNCDRYLEEAHCGSRSVRPVGGTTMDLRTSRSLAQIIQEFQPTCNRRAPRYFLISRAADLRPGLVFVARVLHPGSGRFVEVYSDQPGVDLYTGEHLLPSHEVEEVPSGDSQDCLQPAICDCRSSSSSASLTIVQKPHQAEASDLLPGKCGAKYERFGAFSLLPRNYPSSSGIAQLPPATLRPGQVYYHDLVYQFGVQLDS